MARQKQQTGIMEYARVGFGFGLGSLMSMMIFVFLGFVFFISGFILVKREKKNEKDKKEVNESLKILGYVLMGVGVILGLGMGFGSMLSEVGDEF
mgnify:CR=1 FL=1